MTWPGAAPARTMLDNIYQDFEDPDGNFLEQFQTTGFDQRYFELYLFAYLSRSGFTIDRGYENPDFLVTSENVKVAIEATTANPPQSGPLAKYGKKISELNYDELKEYQNQELPIRMGSPLFSKLKKKYWKKPHCKGLPFVIAMEAFHDDESLTFSDAALTQYLYGFKQKAAWSKEGKLILDTDVVEEHEIKDKKIPSNFFNQPETENISAIIFTNSGTHAKFQRMGYQSGYHCENFEIRRIGFCLNHHPDAMDPSYFAYSLACPPLVESWGQGLVLLHNPNALIPLPRGYFPDAVECYMENNQFIAEHYSWHPLSSKTMIMHFPEKPPYHPRIPSIMVHAIPKQEFQMIYGYEILDTNPILTEEGWFADSSESFLGVICKDKIDGDWAYVVLARDEFSNFRAIENEVSLPNRDEARMKLQVSIAKLLNSEKRIFEQGHA